LRQSEISRAFGDDASAAALLVFQHLSRKEGREQAAGVGRVLQHSDPHGAGFAEGISAVGALDQPGERRGRQRGQQGDDGQGDKKFDQGERRMGNRDMPAPLSHAERYAGQPGGSRKKAVRRITTDRSWVRLEKRGLSHSHGRGPMNAIGVGAGAVEGQRMTLHSEPGRGQLVDTGGAGFDFEHFLAGFAQEVVVMMRVLALVMRRGTRDFHHFHEPLIHKDAQGAVNGGNTQPW
jgi:hypothetical protein